MRKKIIYRRILILALIVNLSGIAVLGIKKMNDSIPDSIKIFVNKEETFNYSYPISAKLKTEDIDVMNVNQKALSKDKINLNFNKTFSLLSNQPGKCKMELKLFGLIHLKNVELDIIHPVKLVPCGFPIGIYVETKGILVLGTSPVPCIDGLNYEPAINILKSGDYITKINGKEVKSKSELIEAIQLSNGKPVLITIRRNNKSLEVKVKTVKSPGGEYKIGVWIRNNTQGIGTLTFIDKNNNFGALGHGITDIDTSLLMEVDKGNIYSAEIMTIVKGKKGTPGEIVGFIHQKEEEQIGTIEINSGQGIYGTVYPSFMKYQTKESLPIGLVQEIKLGKAYIRCNVNGTTQDYEIEIEKIERNNKNKGMVIKITDKKLLEITNGIVQGMSGSPILQNGKIIGAVTHVFVQDSTKGYGTFIENMLKTYY